MTGKSTSKGSSIGGSVVPGIGADFGAGKSGNIHKAAEDAIARAIAFLVAQLDSIPWEGTVILVATN